MRKSSVGRQQAGFTLLELSIVLVIITVIVAGGISLVVVSIDQRRQQETEAKMAVIEKTLLQFRRTFDRIPCPGSITLAITNANFGVEAANAGTCTGGVPAANQSSGNSVEGVIPTKTLRLPDDYAWDGWGRRFVYAVDRRLTAASAFTTYAITHATIGSIEIRDSSGAARTIRGAYILLSHGANGHGAYPLQGGATRIMPGESSGSTNASEQQNCHCDDALNAIAYDGIYVQALLSGDSADPKNKFDDMLLYHTRASLRAAYE